MAAKWPMAAHLRRPPHYTWSLPGALFLVAILLGFVSLTLYQNAAEQRDWVETTGRISDIRERSGGEYVDFSTTIVFTAVQRNGTSVEVTFDSSYGTIATDLNDQVAVFYDPDDVGNATTVRERFAMPQIVGLCALGVLLWSLVLAARLMAAKSWAADHHDGGDGSTRRRKLKRRATSRNAPTP